MNSKHSYNRVENDLQLFHAKEERFVKLFNSKTINKVLLKEKLNYYHAVALKYRGTASHEEKFALRLLAQERKQLAKQLYPNFFLRMIKRLVTPFKQNYILNKDAKRGAQNDQALSEQLRKTGFGHAIPKLEDHIKQGQDHFSVPVSYYVNEKERLDFKLEFAKDQNGLYQFQNYLATLRSDDKPHESIQQSFNIEKHATITAIQAYNLLAGRCIQHAQYEGRNQRTWMQLDFNDKDSSGNYKVKEFNFAYGYDLKHVLQQLPIKELQNQGNFDKLMKALCDGNRQAVSLLRNGIETKVFIEANAQFKSLNIYDENQNKISVATALGINTEKQLGEIIHLNQQTTQSRKNGLSI